MTGEPVFPLIVNSLMRKNYELIVFIYSLLIIGQFIMLGFKISSDFTPYSVVFIPLYAMHFISLVIIVVVINDVSRSGFRRERDSLCYIFGAFAMMILYWLSMAAFIVLFVIELVTPGTINIFVIFSIPIAYAGLVLTVSAIQMLINTRTSVQRHQSTEADDFGYTSVENEKTRRPRDKDMAEAD